MSRKMFVFSFVWEESLSVKEIWPDGDAPESPTVDDVREVFMQSCRGNVRRGMEDWGFLDGITSYDVEIQELHLRPFPDPWLYMPTDREEALWESEGGR